MNLHQTARPEMSLSFLTLNNKSLALSTLPSAWLQKARRPTPKPPVLCVAQHGFVSVAQVSKSGGPRKECLRPQSAAKEGAGGLTPKSGCRLKCPRGAGR